MTDNLYVIKTNNTPDTYTHGVNYVTLMME